MKIIQNFVFLLDTLLIISGNLQDGYSKLRYGYRLDRKMIDSFTEYSILDCVEECLRTTRCTSVSYYKGANYCEISYENKTTAPKRYKQDTGWIYSEKEDWNKKITGSCSTVNCAENEKCIPLSLGNSKCDLSDCGIPNVDGADMDSVERWDAIGIYRQMQIKCKSSYKQKGSGLLNCPTSGQWDINLVCELPQGWTRFDDSIYFVGKSKENWATAMEDCKRRGSTLAEIESAEENDWIKKNLLEHLFQGKTITEWTVSVLWIGGNCPRRSKDKEKCRWQADNSEFSYHNWHDDDPSGDGPCVFLAKDGKWADYPCKHERFYVCEKAA